MDQVDELLALIAAHKEMGVTGASIMLSFSNANLTHPATPYVRLRVHGC
jgi:hypothetical protein